MDDNKSNQIKSNQVHSGWQRVNTLEKILNEILKTLMI
jgi:ubiquitin-protein ligase